MKKTGIRSGIALAGLALFAACTSAPSGPSNAHEHPVAPELREPARGDEDRHIPFDTAEYYRIKSGVDEVSNPKITSQEEFDRHFEAAPPAGQGGQHTPIDFSKQYVIAVVAPQTNRQTVLQPISLQHSEPAEVIFTYRLVAGEVSGNDPHRPVLILIVDREHDGTVVLNEMK